MNYSIVLLFLVSLAIVNAVNELAEFKKVINKSKADCKRDKQPKPNIDRTCPQKTTETLFAEIPGTRATVKPYAGVDLMKTYELCALRELTGKPTSWTEITKNRAKVGLTLASQTWKDCDAQMKLEKADCKSVESLLCAFSQGTEFSCANPQQLKRTSTTLEKGDRCYMMIAYGEGRPFDKKSFTAKLAETKKNCRKNAEVIANKCAQEKTFNELFAELPEGIKWTAYAKPNTDLAKIINTCVERETYGWPNFKTKVNRVLMGPKNRDARNKCLAQVNDEQNTDCKGAAKIVCAFTYGVDFSCANEEQKRRVASETDCRAVENAIATDRNRN